MIQSCLFQADRAPRSLESAAWAEACRDDANLLWIDLEAPSDEEWKQVTDTFGLDRRVVETTRQANRRPLVRVYEDCFLVTAIAIEAKGNGPTTAIGMLEVDILVGRNWLVSAHRRPLPFGDELGERTASNPQIGRFDAAYLLYILLDALLDDYAHQFDLAEDLAERLEERLLRQPGRRMLEDVARTKRHIHALRHFLAPHREAFGTLTAPDSPLSFLPDVDVTPFRELLGRIDGLLQRLEHARDIATGSYELYMSNMSFRTNQQLTVLTFLSAVLLPMTVIVGIFGTNFTLSEYEGWQPFYVMLAGMGLLTVAMFLFFHSKRWL